ncbi:hypothetical protein D3C72_617010 [compost metagenome]
MRAWRVGALMGAVLMMTACGPFEGLVPHVRLKGALEAPSLAFRTVLINSYAFPTEQVVYTAVQSQAEHDALFARQAIPGPQPQPSPDFSKETGILAVFPSQYTGMIWGEITAVEERTDQVVVHTVIWEPNPGSTVTGDIGKPNHYVAIAKTTKPVTFAPTVRAFFSHQPANHARPSATPAS